MSFNDKLLEDMILVCNINHLHTTDCMNIIGKCMHYNCNICEWIKYIHDNEPYFVIYKYNEILLNKNNEPCCKYNKNGKNQCIFINDKKHMKKYEHLWAQNACKECNSKIKPLYQKKVNEEIYVLCKKCNKCDNCGKNKETDEYISIFTKDKVYLCYKCSLLECCPECRIESGGSLCKYCRSKIY
jgi:hypothetical protein